MRTDRQLIVSGGGSRSDTWNQLRADVLNRTLHTSVTPEAGCFAAAMLAHAAHAGRDVRELVRQSAPAKFREFVPKQTTAEHYSRRFEQYTRLYEAMRLMNSG